MTTEEIKQIINDRLKDHYGLDIDESDTLRTAGLDSLDVVELAIEMEKVFNINIPDKEVENFIDQTLNQIIETIQPLIR